MNKKFDRIASIIFLMIGITFIIESRNISSTAYGSVVGPNIFPFILGGILCLLSCRLFYETIKYKEKESESIQFNYNSFLLFYINNSICVIIRKDWLYYQFILISY